MDESSIPPEGPGPGPTSNVPPSGWPPPPPSSPPPPSTPPSGGWSPPPGSYPPPGPPPPVPPRHSSQGTAALIVGALSFLLCCHMLGPVAWYLGWDELRDIRSGRVIGKETNAKIGMALGIIATILFVIGLLWAFMFGGFSVLRGMMHGYRRFGY